MNHKIIRYTLGWVLNIEGILMLLPLICSFCYKEPYMAGAFILSALFCGLIGTLFTFKKPENNTWDCPNCGNKGIDAKFCPECGHKKED